MGWNARPQVHDPCRAGGAPQRVTFRTMPDTRAGLRPRWRRARVTMPATMPTVSVTTAAALAGVDRKTIRRWLGEGAIDLGALLDHAGARPPEAVILAADSGDPDACAELGTFFLEAGMHARAVDWLQRAADRNHADGMHWLARAYLDGRGVERDLNLGLMWLGRSASLGHAISAAQVRALFSGR